MTFPAVEETDVLVAPVPRKPRVLPAVVRFGQVAVQIARVTAVAALDVCLPRTPRFPATVASALERLGGAFLKIGQVLASRPDLVAPATREALGRLCDRVQPLGSAATEAALRGALTAAQWSQIADVDATPIASGSVAQIHHVTLRDDGAQLVLKVLRPDAPLKFTTDVAIMTFFARWLAKLPWSAPFSLQSAFAEIARSTTQQLDLRREREHHADVSRAFADRTGLLVPTLYPALCSDTAVAMEHVSATRRIDAPELDEQVRQSAVVTGVRALYSMLFEHGIVHCDLHPGNLLVANDGTLVLLDFGYMARMDNRTRRAFASLFIAIAWSDAARATRVVLDTAAFLPPDLDQAALLEDLRGVLGSASGAKVGAFSITAFVLTLFDVERKHRIRASPAFVMAIMSLLSYEGLLRMYTPSLDFQKESLPYVMSALRDS